ncbi:glycosyltransferase [Rhizorhabdus dicambivorans]|uniref:Glycosyltransferase family 2 protein n=1 Tax=Rhizorhabdus dicambivorans TaxID=1850238 RepID=A0A2A4G1A2_9SPHN|nr:glycosyltransferase family 2 protein [Rhizorhabdus dicambivorans]ATE64988.1 glycosyltransferase family 2 protein [Rhizorhabdus dicambivorans]PCE44261.1 glycosyltransferase family 2 protein [Rhizorhabdus dicambivorans]
MSMIEGKNGRKGKLTAPELSIIIPTYNERGNIAALVDAVRKALGAIPWEMIIVDDDSPDQTFNEVARLARDEPRLRCLRRVGRRGLSSAVIEGVMVANGGAIAVMDADFQHDERILGAMYEKLVGNHADIVVATRYAEGGGIGEWDANRARMSDFATRMAGMLVGNQTSDPMSGFFMVRREVFAGVIYDLSQQGYKILLDIISSSHVPLKIEEVPYTFRTRQEGESKISIMVLAQFLFLIIEKLTHGLIPPRFALFSIVGGFGLLVHLTVLNSLKLFHFDFMAAQITAIGVSMVSNFIMNNEFTYRDRRLTGLSFIAGLILFCIVCSFGALANVGVAEIAIKQVNNWSFAGLAGAIMGAVFNFSAATSLVWRRPRKRIFAAAA